MTSPPASAPPPPTRRRDALLLVIRLAAVVAVGYGQARVVAHAGAAVAAFAVGAALVVLAERLSLPAVPTPASSPAGTSPRGFWLLLALGSALCAAAGIMVHRQAAILTTHSVWAVGLALFILAAVRARRPGGRRTKPAARTLCATALVIVLAAALYAPQLGSMPPEMHGDEGEVGMDAVALLETYPFNLFTTGWYELPRFHALRMAGGLKLFGINAVGLRSSSVLLGALTAVLLFAVGRALWGFEVGLLAAILLVSARFFVHLSRTGMHYLDAPFFSTLTVWFFTRMLREPRLGGAVWCGLALGIGIQSYFAVRLVPVLLVLTWIVWTVGSPRAVLRERTRWLVTAGIAAIATVAPMIGYFWEHWDLFWARTRGTSIFAEAGFKHLSYGYQTDDLWRIVLIQAQRTLPLFNRSGDTSLQYGFGDGGLFEPVTAALFVLGLAVVLARPLQRRHLLVLIWTTVPVVLGGMLTIDAPFYPRLSGCVPFAALIAAVGLHRVLDSVRSVTTGRLGATTTLLIAAATLTAVCINNVQSYFFSYAPRHIHGPGVPLAAWIRERGAGKTTYMLGPGFPIKHGTVRFLAYGYATQDIADLAPYLSGDRFDPATSLFVAMAENRALLDQLQRVAGPLRIDAHRNRFGAVSFYTAVPVSAGTQ